MSAGCVVWGVRLRRLVIALGLVLLPLAAAAAPSPSPSPSFSPSASASATPSQVRNGGTIDGRVASIDYQRNILGIDTPSRGRIDVSVMPSTNIQGNDSAYHTFTDLKTGQRVQIMSSIADGKYVAQIIRIR
jgi:hypothetical protein